MANRGIIDQGDTVTDWLTATMSDYRQRTVIKVSFHPQRVLLLFLNSEQVFRKYSHALGPDVLEFLEGVLDKHEIRDEDVEYSVDLIAKEYNKQDGK